MQNYTETKHGRLKHVLFNSFLKRLWICKTMLLKEGDLNLWFVLGALFTGNN